MSTPLGIAFTIYFAGATVTLVIAIINALTAKEYADNPYIGAESRDELRRALATIKGGFLLWPLLVLKALKGLEEASREPSKDDQ